MKVKMMFWKKDIKIHYLLFFVGYTLYFISMFLGDVVEIGNGYEMARNILKYVAYVFWAVAAISTSKSKRELILFIVLLGVGIGLFIWCDVFYFCIMFLTAFAATKIDEMDILKFSFYLLLILLVITLALCATGVLENVITHRFLGDPLNRYGLGFSHSNVVPLILLYLNAYWIVLHKENVKTYQYVGMAILNIIAYLICRSRNAILLSTILLLGSFLITKIKFGKIISGILSFVTKYMALFLVLFSTVATVYLNQYKIFQVFDSLFTTRFSQAFRKMSRLGLHLVTAFDTDTFFSDGIIVDSAYSYVVIRYGLIVAFLVAFLFYNYASKKRNDLYTTLVILVILVLNFIDNDMFDYSCLPFMIIALKILLSGLREERLKK